MPGAMRKMGVYLGLVEDDEDAYGADGADSYDRGRMTRADQSERYQRGADPTGHVVHREWTEADAAAGAAYAGEYADYEYPAYRITTLHPRTYNEARTIGEHFRSNTPVIMNLSEMDDADAKRLVDFAAGLTFGLHGRIERVTAKVFLLSPNNVTVTAADKARIAEGGFFNQS
ncbi:MAG: cell division protein SepF [Actinomycetota bacterium]